MKTKCSLFVVLLLLCTSTLFAQSETKADNVEFNPHWYLQLQGGVAHTVGEAKFKDLISPAAAIYAGYHFTPVWGVRAGFSGWQAKGAWVSDNKNRLDYKYNYLQLNADATFNLINCVAGYNPDRWFDMYLFAGLGGNYSFNNDEAVEINDAGHTLTKLWRDNKVFVAGRAGVGLDFRLAQGVIFNLEGNVNALSDKFNSKKGSKFDYQYNMLAGFKFALGKTSKSKPVEVVQKSEYVAPAEPVAPKEEEPAPKPVVEEEVVEQPVAEPVVEPAKENIFFKLNSSVVRQSEVAKIDELVAYMNKYEKAKITLTGYADVQTGNPRYNMALSQRRADSVAKALVDRGISRDRINTVAKGDVEQPFSIQAENRVVICLSE